MSMAHHLVIDARYVRHDGQTVHPEGGIGRYTYFLAQQLLRQEPELPLTLLVPATNRGSIVEAHHRPYVREIPVAAPAHSLRTLWTVLPGLQLDPNGLFHSPFNVLPWGYAGPSVTTVHDLMWLTDPHLAEPSLPLRTLKAAYYRAGIGHALRASEHIFTVSECSRAAILAYAPHLEGRVSVTYNGVSAQFHPMEQAAAFKDSTHLVPDHENFVLCVGQGSPYKNHLRAVTAFLQAFSGAPEMKLVLVRRFSRADHTLRNLLETPQAKRQVRVFSELHTGELRALYNRARIFLFPSLWEGFGMPVIEAMACGTPVLTSTQAALQEVAGDAALCVDPYSVEAIAEGLVRLHEDADLRAQLQTRGLIQASKFTWSACAAKTLEVYRRFLQLPSA